MEPPLFIFVRPHLYSILGSKPIEVFMPDEIASLIEVHWRICILLIFVIVYSIQHLCALVRRPGVWCHLYLPITSYWIGAFVQILIFFILILLCTINFSNTVYLCGLQILFLF